jgi:hypothetical protein
MVSGIIKLALILIISGSVARAEIDLTPTYSTRQLEGCKFQQLEFRDTGKRITYEPPKGWTSVAQNKSTLALSPPNGEMVSAKIKFMPVPGLLVLDEVQLNHFRETASQLLPPESTINGEPTVTPDPILLNGRHTCEIDIVFGLHSHRLRMSVLFVDLGESQLRFSLIARPADFDELHKAFQDSWYSWQWLERQE